MNRLLMSRVLAVATAMLAVTSASAQTYPERPVRLIVPFAPGGTTDMVARVVGSKLTELLGQTVVIDNKAGAGTIVGTENLARSRADGYNIMLATPDLTINPALRPTMPYNTLKDFVPIALIATYPMIMVTPGEQQLTSIAELLSQAKARPGQINFASAGYGTMPHLCAELFNSLAGVKMTHIPYKGNGPAIIDLLAGRVSVLFSGGPPVEPHVKSGKLRMLGVTTSQRHATLPDVPTVAEAGVPGYEVTAWFGFIAPAGTPAPIVRRLNTEIGRALAAPEVREKLASLGATFSVSSPEAFRKLIDDEVAKWSRVVKEANIKVD